MPHFKREIRPGNLVHMIARFVNNEQRLRHHSERTEYLSMLGRALTKIDWSLIGYALMSTHIHLSFFAGFAPFDRLARMIHPAFSRWLNRRQHKRGPLLSERPTTYTIDVLNTPRLIAYLHNNPVRAGLCVDANSSSWTSHRAYSGIEQPPPGLQVDLGLKVCGLDSSSAGRAQFNKLVNISLNEGDSWALSVGELSEHRREARDALGSAVLLGYPHLSSGDIDEAAYPVLSEQGLPVHTKWSGGLQSLVDYISSCRGMTPKLVQSKDRTRTAVNARRIILLIALKALGRGLSETCRSLGITPAAGLKLIRTSSPKTLEEAEMLLPGFLQMEKVKR